MTSTVRLPRKTLTDLFGLMFKLCWHCVYIDCSPLFIKRFNWQPFLWLNHIYRLRATGEMPLNSSGAVLEIFNDFRPDVWRPDGTKAPALYSWRSSAYFTPPPHLTASFASFWAQRQSGICIPAPCAIHCGKKDAAVARPVKGLKLTLRRREKCGKRSFYGKMSTYT